MKRFSPELPEHVDKIFSESDEVAHQLFDDIYNAAIGEPMNQDRHHILHNRPEWSLRSQSRYLREQHSLIPKMWRDDHEELHRNCPPVPLIGYYALLRTVRLWTPGKDTEQSVDNLLFAMEEANKSPKAYPLERDLGELAMQAIELQRPYLQNLPE